MQMVFDLIFQLYSREKATCMHSVETVLWMWVWYFLGLVECNMILTCDAGRQQFAAPSQPKDHKGGQYAYSHSVPSQPFHFLV